MRNIRLAFDKSRVVKKKGGKNEPKKEELEVKKTVTAKIFVANQYADWQKFVLDVICGCNFNNLTIVDDWKIQIRTKTTGDLMKRSLQFGSWILVYSFFFFNSFNEKYEFKDDIQKKGNKDILNTNQMFREKEFLLSQKETIARLTKLDQIEVFLMF